MRDAFTVNSYRTFANFRKFKKVQGSLGNVGERVFVFTNFQTDNYTTSSGDDEENCEHN